MRKCLQWKKNIKTPCICSVNILDMRKGMNEIKRRIEQKYNVKITEVKPATVNA